MQNKTVMLATTLVALSATFSSPAQGTMYQLEPGGLYTPVGGAATSLTGTFVWAAPVAVFDPNSGGLISQFDATALSFQAGVLAFRLNASALNDCASSLVPGPTGPVYGFCEVVDAFDGSGALLETGLHIVGGAAQGSDAMTRLSFPNLGVYRNYNSPNPELLGSMAFSAVVIPEPDACLLITLGLAALHFRRRFERAARFIGTTMPPDFRVGRKRHGELS